MILRTTNTIQASLRKFEGRTVESSGKYPAQWRVTHKAHLAYKRAFLAIEADPNQFLAVVEEAGEVVGTLQIFVIPGFARTGASRGQIEAVRVASHRRNGGLGRRMFEWAIAECRARGCSLVQLTTDRERPDAHRFYDRLGFIATHLGYKLVL
jgi:GNAT superfamily N-acetyltransferase